MDNENQRLDINSRTQLVGLFGWPVSHSVSPAMHNAAFRELGLNWRYLPLPVPVDPRQRIQEAVLGLRAMGLRGANVTVPHKQAVMPWMDELTSAARAIGAVNTIIVQEDGTLLGDNTDGAGFVADLQAQGVNLAGKRALVLGAGGSARAVVYGLAEAGCVSVDILNRTVSKAMALAKEMGQPFPACTLAGHELPDQIPQVAEQAELIINCTSLGMTPHVESMPWDEETLFSPHQVIYDLIYNPPVTRLLQMAAADGATTIGGLGMLIYQGAIAFSRWTGEDPPVAIMREAALRQMEGR